MISTSGRRARLLRLFSTKLVKCLATVTTVFLVGVAMPAQATLLSVSVNFAGGAPNSLAAGDIAGDPALGSFANWNNMVLGGPLTLGSLKLSDGTVTGASVQVSGNGQSGTLNAINTIAVPAGGGISAPNIKMMGSGLKTEGNNGVSGNVNGGGVNGTGVAGQTGTVWVSFSGLSAAFPNGYRAYIYQDAGAGNSTTGGWNDGNAVSRTLTNFPSAFTPDPGIVLTAGGTNADTSNATFANDWGSNNHEFKATLAANAVITSDTLTVYDRVGPLATGVLKRNTMTGIQIIGDVVSTTPTTFDLAAQNVANSQVIVGGTTTFDSKITNTGTPPGTADTLNYTGLSATASSGSVSGGPGSGGPLANNSVGVGTQSLTYNSTGATIGNVTLTPVRTTATNGTLGGAATLGTTTTASVAVLAHSNGDFGNVAGAATPTFGLNSLTLDFGTVEAGAGGGFLDSFFDVFNTIDTPSFTAAMDLDTNIDSTGVGDVLKLFRQLGATTFSNLPGGGQAYAFRLDTTTLGLFSATYQFKLSDQNLPGATVPDSEVLTLTLLGNVVPEPSTWALGALGLLGLLGYALSRRRREKS